jgi:hypothetical protein
VEIDFAVLRNELLFDKVLQQMWEKVRQRQYVMTLHAEEEMADDELSIYDIESVILTGEILERQKDKNTDESKYRINGLGLENTEIEVIAKLSLTGKLVIITVYLC